MKRSGIIKYSITNGEAVSENIGVILMISLVVVGIALVSVIITGQSTPTEIPSMSMIPDTTDTDLILYHSGGDALKEGEFLVRVDGMDYYPDEITLIDQGGDTYAAWDSWDVGEALEIPGKSDYKQVQIISTSGGQASLIAGSGEAVVTAAPTGTTTPTATITATPTPTVTLTPTPGPLPVADFTVNETSGIAPMAVKFTDLSTNSPYLWSWTFGDGGVSEEQNPTYIYNSGGVYNVSLTASNVYGNDSVVKTGYITVTDFPQPAAWWKFDEASGTTVLDSSGNNNNGVISGSYSRPAGACDNALEFDGTTTYVTVPDSNTLDAPNYITYTAWLMPEPPLSSYIDNYTSLIDKGMDDVDNYEFFISRLGSTSEFSFETNSGGFLDYSTNDFDYEYGKWQHVAFVADTDLGTAKLYIDGEYAATLTSSLPSSFTTNDNALTIGMQQYGTYTFRYKGLMDEVMLFTVPLTADQISTIYDTCTPPPAPVAGFSASPLSGLSPLIVTFADLSTGTPTSWLWNFGDGTTSTSQNPVHTYTGGIYDVTLTVSNAGGYSAKTVENLVTVNYPVPPVAAFSGSPLSGVSPLSVTFSDSSTGAPTSWLWNFGDGGTSTLQNPVHNYASAGTYTVSLRATNAYGFDDEVKVNYITTSTPLVAEFHFDVTSSNNNFKWLHFYDDSTGSPTGWLWDFGDGGTSTLQNPSHRYNRGSTYTVTLTVYRESLSNTISKSIIVD